MLGVVAHAFNASIWPQGWQISVNGVAGGLTNYMATQGYGVFQKTNKEFEQIFFCAIEYHRTKSERKRFPSERPR